MAYRISKEAMQAVTSDQGWWTCDKIEENLHKLRTWGPEYYDKPTTVFEEAVGNDYEGYTEQWLDLLGAEKDRRIGAGTWVLRSRVS